MFLFNIHFVILMLNLSFMQTLLMKWILLVYNFLDNHENLHALYGVIFSFLETECLVCEILNVYRIYI